MSEVDLRTGKSRGRQPAGAKSAPGRFWPLRAVLHDATSGLFRHDGMMVASAIAFSLVFAMFPFAIFVVALGSILGGTELASYLSSQAVELLPERVTKMVQPELESVLGGAGGARPLTFGIAVTLVSITGAVEAVRHGLNRAYGCPEGRHPLRLYLSSLLFVFLAILFLLLVAGLGIVMPIGLDVLHRYFPETRLELQFLEVAREALLVLITTAMLFALHYFLPAVRRHFKEVVIGVFITLVGWWLSAKIFSVYISSVANYSATYAGLAGIVVLMFFLYIQAVVFLFGAEVNRAIIDLRSDSRRPREG